MADGSLTITLDEDAVRRLKLAADAAGAEPEVFARRLIEDTLQTDRWSVTLERLAEFDRTGEGIPMDEALDRVRTMIAELRAAR